MRKELRVISTEEFGMLLYQIDQLPSCEARELETELKETYWQCLDKFIELDTLVNKIRNRNAGKFL